MRKGRFAGLSDRGQEAVASPGLAELLLFDFTAPADEDDDRAAHERARTIALSLPLLTGAHFLWSAALLGGLAAGGMTGGLAPLATLLMAILVLDGLLWLALERPRLRPYQAVRIAALHGLATAGMWLGAALVVPAEAQTVMVKAALIVGAGSAIPLFFSVPLLMTLAVATAFGVAAVLPTREPVVPIGAAFSLFLLCVGIARSRQLLTTARRRLSLEWQAEKARRFVSDFEASGRGWFWETNADGALTYVSEPLAQHLGVSAPELIGRRFEDVLLDSAGEDDSRRTLGFHLSARFPFAEVVVRAPAAQDVWWSLSGSPNFDHY
ncbi:MAG TPA: PAS domain-containing protein, partial [Allosphingosinicella sp.]